MMPLKLSFLIFSMLLNCMGIVILQLSHHISYTGLGFLEAFKDLPIAAISIFAATYIDRFGSRLSLMFSLFVVALCCMALPFLKEFWFFKVWFSIIGFGFAVAKISVFGIIRNNIYDEKLLSKSMNSVEAYFMIGIFLVNIGFGWLLSSKYSEFWTFGFWAIGALAFANGVLLYRSNYREVHEENPSGFLANFGDVFLAPNFLFLGILFTVVFVEQSFNSWLPAFFKKNLGVNSYFALQSSAFLALFSFLGRVATSRLIMKVPMLKILTVSLASIITLLLACQLIMSKLPENSHYLLVFFPLVGLFMAPLYPLYNSRLLYKYGQENVSRLVSLVVMVSSLGSSLGSLAMAQLFQMGMSPFYALYIAVIVCADRKSVV